MSLGLCPKFLKVCPALVIELIDDLSEATLAYLCIERAPATQHLQLKQIGQHGIDGESVSKGETIQVIPLQLIYAMLPDGEILLLGDL